MGMTETASRIIARFGQTGTFERAGEPVGDAWNKRPGTPTFHTATVAVMDFDEEYRRGKELIAEGDLRVLVSLDGLTITPKLSDRLSVGGTNYTVQSVSPLAPDGTVRFFDLVVVR